ncbi:hypothetical protein [Alkalihalobacillus sp. CinArs1]|uniref:hypothetical protein n=1 Tax=Alkalihalobacillus sp. CinArs1 TaxID=2995314 RepID=UPI0022DD2B71|nr:hypothetical protein [Alkalihalobacillus sp. CinArs1]
MTRILSVLVMVTLLFMGFQNTASAHGHGEPPVKEIEEKFLGFYNNLNADPETHVVNNYHSMEEMEKVFAQIMVPGLAEAYVSEFFKEEDGKLLHRPQDGPSSIEFNSHYDLQKVNNNHYKLSQKLTGELHGGQTLTIDYIYQSGKWIFGNRNNILPEVHVDGSTDDNHDETTGDQLPDTATFFPTSIMVGVSVMLVGALLLVARKRSNA